MDKPCVKCGSTEERYKTGSCKPCARARTLRWRSIPSNKEKDNANSRRWAAANPEIAAERSAKWRAENAGRKTANDARWRAENAGRAKRNSERWRAANPDKVAASYARYVTKHQLRLSIEGTLRHLRNQNAKNEALWLEMMKE